MKKLLIIFFVLSTTQISYAQRTKGQTAPPQKTKTTTTSTGVGVNINLGGVLHALKRKCNQVKIIYPKVNENLKVDSKSALVFKWKSSKPKSVKSYKVGLAVLDANNKKMLYQADTYKTQLDWPKNVVWGDVKKGKTTYQFFVMALMKKGSKCKNVVVSNVFSLVSDKPFLVDNQQKKSNNNVAKADAGNALNALGGDATARGRRKARKACIASGGDFIESADSYVCIHKMSTLRSGNTDSDEVQRSKKRKCWKARGNWVTNANGSYCSHKISKK